MMGGGYPKPCYRMAQPVLKNIIYPTWNVSYFIRRSTNAASASTFISVRHVSAHNLKSPCTTSLLK